MTRYLNTELCMALLDMIATAHWLGKLDKLDNRTIFTHLDTVSSTQNVEKIDKSLYGFFELLGTTGAFTKNELTAWHDRITDLQPGTMSMGSMAAFKSFLITPRSTAFNPSTHSPMSPLVRVILDNLKVPSNDKNVTDELSVITDFLYRAESEWQEASIGRLANMEEHDDYSMGIRTVPTTTLKIDPITGALISQDMSPGNRLDDTIVQLHVDLSNMVSMKEFHPVEAVLAFNHHKRNMIMETMKALSEGTMEQRATGYRLATWMKFETDDWTVDPDDVEAVILGSESEGLPLQLLAQIVGTANEQQSIRRSGRFMTLASAESVEQWSFWDKKILHRDLLAFRGHHLSLNEWLNR